MSRAVLGILFGIAFGVIDLLMTVLGKHPDRTTAMLLQAFFSRFAIGFLAANVSLRMHPALVLHGAVKTEAEDPQRGLTEDGR